MNKKAVSLSLETVVIAIIILVVIITIVYFIVSQGNLFSSIFRDQANNTIALIPDKPLP